MNNINTDPELEIIQEVWNDNCLSIYKEMKICDADHKHKKDILSSIINKKLANHNSKAEVSELEYEFLVYSKIEAEAAQKLTASKTNLLKAKQQHRADIISGKA